MAKRGVYVCIGRHFEHLLLKIDFAVLFYFCAAKSALGGYQIPSSLLLPLSHPGPSPHHHHIAWSSVNLTLYLSYTLSALFDGQVRERVTRL